MLPKAAYRANSLAEKSITRLWFIGHAAPEGLWLYLRHEVPNQPFGAYSPPLKDIITKDILDDILVTKIDTSSTKLSRFIGCNTSTVPVWEEAMASSAEAWRNHSGLRSLGYSETIHFGNYDQFINPADQQPNRFDIFSPPSPASPGSGVP